MAQVEIATFVTTMEDSSLKIKSTKCVSSNLRDSETLLSVKPNMVSILLSTTKEGQINLCIMSVMAQVETSMWVQPKEAIAILITGEDKPNTTSAILFATISHFLKYLLLYSARSRKC